MDIYINNQRLDAKLSDEKNIGEVYDQISNWSSENKRYILSLLVDREDVSVSRLREIPLERVDRLDFFIGDEMDMLITTVEEMDRYVDQIGSTLFELQEMSEKESADLHEGIHWIREIMGSVSSLLKVDFNDTMTPSGGERDGEDISVAKILDNLEADSLSFLKGSDRTSIERFLENLRSFKYYIMKLDLQLRAMHSGLEELLETVEEFDQILPRLVEEASAINVRFNEGKDGSALESLENLTGRLNVYLSSLFALDYRLQQEKGEGLSGFEVDGVPFSQKTSALTDLLQDLSSALEENDIVAVGDILEYEVTEKLSELQPYLSGIRQLVVARN